MLLLSRGSPFVSRGFPHDSPRFPARFPVVTRPVGVRVSGFVWELVVLFLGLVFFSELVGLFGLSRIGPQSRVRCVLVFPR